MKLSKTFKLGLLFVFLCLVVLLAMFLHTPHEPNVVNSKDNPIQNNKTDIIDAPVADVQAGPHIELLDWTWDETRSGVITINGRFKSVYNGHLHGVKIAPVLFDGIRRLDPHHDTILFGKHRIDYRIEEDRVVPFSFRIHKDDYGFTEDSKEIEISLEFSTKPSIYDDPIQLKLK